jgi:hypothetical protein
MELPLVLLLEKDTLAGSAQNVVPSEVNAAMGEA